MLPRFITLEGGEGAGKTTQVNLLQAALKAANISCITTREPGGSMGAEAIRHLVVQEKAPNWHPTTEALLFMAARLDHVESVIKPALARGTWVLCDRFYDSTYVYQGIAKKVGGAWLDGLYTALFGNFAPHATLLLDMPPQQGLARTAARNNHGETRFEAMPLDYHENLRAGFLARAAGEPERIHIVNAGQSSKAVHAEIITHLNGRFSLQLAVQSANPKT